MGPRDIATVLAQYELVLARHGGAPRKERLPASAAQLVNVITWRNLPDIYLASKNNPGEVHDLCLRLLGVLEEFLGGREHFNDALLKVMRHDPSDPVLLLGRKVMFGWPTSERSDQGEQAPQNAASAPEPPAGKKQLNPTKRQLRNKIQARLFELYEELPLAVMAAKHGTGSVLDSKNDPSFIQAEIAKLELELQELGRKR